jgi:hypothetical protein
LKRWPYRLVDAGGGDRQHRERLGNLRNERATTITIAIAKPAWLTIEDQPQFRNVGASSASPLKARRADGRGRADYAQHQTTAPDPRQDGEADHRARTAKNTTNTMAPVRSTARAASPCSLKFHEDATRNDSSASN